MSGIAINEPQASRDIALTPQSVNEPASLPEWATEPPVVDAISPADATIGDDSFDVYLTGTGFYAESVIVFAGHDEPTTLNEDGTLSTGVNMAVWHGPDTVKVSVRNGPIASNAVDFTFLAEPEAGAELADPDDLEEEIEAAAEEGDFRSTHRGKPAPKRKIRR